MVINCGTCQPKLLLTQRKNCIYESVIHHSSAKLLVYLSTSPQLLSPNWIENDLDKDSNIYPKTMFLVYQISQREFTITNSMLTMIWQDIENDEYTYIVKLIEAQETHICVGNLTIIGSDNCLMPGKCKAIIWTNVGLLWFGPLGTHFSDIWITIPRFSLKQIHLKMSSRKYRSSLLGLNVINTGNAAIFHRMTWGSWGQHGAHLGTTGPMCAPCWPHESCYLGIGYLWQPMLIWSNNQIKHCISYCICWCLCIFWCWCWRTCYH